MKRVIFLVVLSACIAACGGSVPDTHYYELVVPAHAQPARLPMASTIGLEPFSAAAAYGGDRIAYKTSAYRLDYYHYHRWSAAPSLLVRAFLRDAYIRAGLPVCGSSPAVAATVTLGGRLIALREIDVTPSEWVGEIVIDLWVSAPSSGRTIWFQSFVERERLSQRSPEGLARAISAALARIADRSAAPVSHAVATLQY